MTRTTFKKAIIISISVGLLIGLASLILLISSSNSSTAQDAVLEGVSPSDLSSSGIELTKADGGSEVPSDKANSLALGDWPDAKIRETVLVYMTNGAQYKEPRLAWAVNFDPATIKITRHGPPGSSNLPPNLRVAVMFVDAKSGEFLFFTSSGTSQSAAETAPAD